jgi:hypothetical protein
MARQLLWITGWACLLLGCGWSRTALAQGSTLLPPLSPPASTTAPALPTPQPPKQESIQQTGGAVPRGEVRSRVIARVNGDPILHEELVNAASFMLEDLKTRNFPPNVAEQYEKQILSKALDDLITRESILQDAGIKVPPQGLKKIEDLASKEFDKLIKKDIARLGIKKPEELKEYYKKQGRSLELLRRQYVRQALATEWIRTLCRDRTDRETTREQLLEYYQANSEEFQKKERVVWQHMFIDVDRYPSVAAARHQAEVAWQLLRNTKTEEEFSALVEKYADGFSKARRGLGEGSFKGEIKPVELEKFVLDQPTGGQGPVVETTRGFHVFRVSEHTPAETVSFEKACNDIKKKLENKIYEEEFKKLSKEMRERAYVEMLMQE